MLITMFTLGSGWLARILQVGDQMPALLDILAQRVHDFFSRWSVRLACDAELMLTRCGMSHIPQRPEKRNHAPCRLICLQCFCCMTRSEGGLSPQRERGKQNPKCFIVLSTLTSAELFSCIVSTPARWGLEGLSRVPGLWCESTRLSNQMLCQ